jgi:aminopeptidase N
VLWEEHSKGEADARKMLVSFYDVARSSGQGIVIGNPGPDNLFDRIVYDRGALTLHALRLRVGDEVFFEILQTYYERYRDGNATTEDFIGVAEEVSGEELEPLFIEWLYRSELPDIPEMGLYAEGSR